MLYHGEKRGQLQGIRAKSGKAYRGWGHVGENTEFGSQRTCFRYLTMTTVWLPTSSSLSGSIFSSPNEVNSHHYDLLNFVPWRPSILQGVQELSWRPKLVVETLWYSHFSPSSEQLNSYSTRIKKFENHLTYPTPRMQRFAVCCERMIITSGQSENERTHRYQVH